MLSKPCLVAARLLPLLGLVASLHAGPYRLARTVPTGVGPGEMLLTAGGSLLVIANSDSADLTVISTRTWTASPAIPVGRVPIPLAADATGAVLVGCFRENAVYRVDPASGRVLGSVKVGQGPYDVAVTPRGKALVACYYSGDLFVLDPATLAIEKTVDLGVGLRQIVFPPGSQKVLVLNASSDRIHVLDLVSLGEIATLVDKLGMGLNELCAHPVRQEAVVSGWISGTVGVVDARRPGSRALVATTGKGCGPIALSPDGSRAYVSHTESDSVALVDLAAERQLAITGVGRFPFSDLQVSPDGAHVLVTNDKDGTVTVLRGSDLALLQTLRVGAIPRYIRFLGGTALVTCNDANHVAVLEPTGRSAPTLRVATR